MDFQMREKLFDTLRARREGGMVERCHTMPHIGSYSVAAHSYGVAQIIRTFHSNPPLELIGAALDHDVAERWVGDTPATAKWLSPLLRDALHTAEHKIQDRFGLDEALTQEERRWLKAADILELWLWAEEQVFMGNRCARNITLNIVEFVGNRAMELFPEPLFDLWIHWTARRLPEMPDGLLPTQD